MKPNIVLIGFMGTGKTTIGKILAERLNKTLIEMDDLIVEKARKSIPKIFEEDGEIKFRELEMSVCKDLSTATDVIISAGGGVILNKLNIDYLAQSASIVLLEAAAKDIFDRISLEGKEKRPLLNNTDPLAEIRKLLTFRRPFYNAAADFKISTFKKIPEQIAAEIIETLNKPKKKISQGDLYSVFNDASEVLFDEKEGDLSSDIQNTKESANKILSEQLIIEKCIKADTQNPLKILGSIFSDINANEDNPMNNGIIPGVLLSILRTYQKNNGINKLTYTDKTGKKKIIDIEEINKEKIIVAIRRGLSIPFGCISYLGISEAAIGVGIAISVMLGTTPKTPLLKEIANEGTMIALEDLIRKNLVQKGDLQEIIESVIISALKFFSKSLNLEFIQ